MTCNGWTNWETWMINLHFDGYFEDYRNEDGFVKGAVIEDVVKDIVNGLNESDNSLLDDIINGTLSEVDWQEIADHYNMGD